MISLGKRNFYVIQGISALQQENYPIEQRYRAFKGGN